MSDYTETLNYLYALQWRGLKLGLHNTRSLLKAVGHPEQTFPCIHIAGTNGKGSTSAFIASVAMEAGYRTGLYTSPHLLRFTERIRINGEELSERRLVYYVRVLRPAIEALHATFFEATTCIAFLYFADEGIDLGVIETGLGGRFDATNVITPLVSVITNVGLDHTEYLGTTIRSIAKEKAGIIKQGVPVVTGAEARDALNVLRATARRRHAKLSTAEHLISVKRAARGAILMRGKYLNAGRVVPGLRGPHQIANARLALATWDVIAGTGKLRGQFSEISAASVRKGFAHVRENTGLHGRLEILRGKQTIILDVAHNPPGMAVLAESLKEAGIVPDVVVFGVMADKDYLSMLPTLKAISPRLVAVAPRMERALDARAVQRSAMEAGLEAVHGGGVGRGISRAKRIAGEGGTILITGSHYVVAAALGYLKKKLT